MVSYFNLFRHINNFWQDFLKYIFRYFVPLELHGSEPQGSCKVDRLEDLVLVYSSDGM